MTRRRDARSLPRSDERDHPHVAARPTTSTTAHSAAWYVVVGVLSYSVDLGILALLYTSIGVPLWLATTTGFLAAFALNFWLNRKVTFGSRSPMGAQLMRYFILVCANLLASVLMVGAAEAIGLGYVLGKTASVAILVLVNFIAYRSWVFR